MAAKIGGLTDTVIGGENRLLCKPSNAATLANRRSRWMMMRKGGARGVGVADGEYG
jgi:hypothetical protein